MNFQKTWLYPLVAFALIGGVPARAADDTAIYSSNNSTRPVGPFSGGAEVNLSLATGNTDIQTYGAAAFMDYKGETLTTRLKAGFMQNHTDDAIRARRVDASLRTGFNITNNVDFFGLGTYMQNPFKGIGSQVMLTPGLGIYAVNSDAASLRVEGGLGYMWETFTPALYGDRSFTLGTAGLGLRFKLSDVADLTDDFSWIIPFVQSTDWRMNNTAAVTTAVSQHFSLKVSYTVEYRHVPVAAHKTTDTFTTAAVVLKI